MDSLPREHELELQPVLECSLLVTLLILDDRMISASKGLLCPTFRLLLRLLQNLYDVNYTLLLLLEERCWAHFGWRHPTLLTL